MKDAGKLANMVDGTTGGMQPVEKVCITSGKVLEHFESAKAAATSLGTYGPKLSDYIRSPHQDNNIEPFMGYHWRFRQVEEPSEQAPPELSGTRHALLRALFMQLRKCCNHPFLFEGAEGDPNTTSLEDLVSSSGKLAVLDMLLLSLFQKGNRAVLFTQFTMLLDLLEDYCLMRGWKYCRLDGSTERARRNYLIQRFNEPRSPYFLFLMSTRSGGMGLNLQSADTCILFDSDWNPQCDIQGEI